MRLFDTIATMGHERVLVCSNPDLGLRAIIALHSTVLGPALGGTRMWPYASDEEAITDVLRLSRGMTYKAAAAGLALGGGKAVIIGDPHRDKSEGLFRAFGRFIDSLGGAYITAEDVGTSTEDMEHIAAETRWVTGIAVEHGGSGDPSPVTAYGVYQGIVASVDTVFGSPDLAGRSVAIQGLGKVGRYLAKHLVDSGAKVFGCDVHAGAADQARALGVEIVSLDDINELPVDVFAPCALGAGLDDQTIPRLRCKIVAGGANNQLADENVHGAALVEHGILYAPDFVINAGGIINVFSEATGQYDRERALRRTRTIATNLRRIYHTAKTEGIPTHTAAVRLAEERIATANKLGARQWSRPLRQG
jgi:leucine dehydrogenase